MFKDSAVASTETPRDLESGAMLQLAYIPDPF